MPAELSATVGSSFDLAEIKGWLPVDVVIRDGRPGVVWMDLQEVTLTEPFFHQTVARIKRERNTPERFTDLNALVQLEKLEIGGSPTGFIFHSSRCGSTVITNAFKTIANTLVISEAFAVDKLITRFLTDVGDDKTKELVYSVLLRGIVEALGQRQDENQTHYLLKFSSHSVLHLERIKRIWPNVPRVFVYRDPVEVIVSNLQSEPEWMRFEINPSIAAAVIDADLESIPAMSPEEYCARVLGRILSIVGGSVDECLRLINYEELSLGCVLNLAGFLRLEPTSYEIKAMESSMRSYAKDEVNPRPFVADSKEKRGAASRTIETMSEKWARGPYLDLERQRLAQRHAYKSS